ncbi:MULTISPECIES: respiratory chain complex I subunit 1 family protein [unclassified Adlercreutzia]|uniref:respiratory chain complex I subunit 1 family protein n=1 Tax=unclassified Adlercreutzia TaxID=2636013 RepID=UPI001F15544A|nr:MULTISPECIES: complex I subunit 1 family protein [unclassified Adlercreutzia]
MTILITLIGTLLFAVLAPVAGCLLAGLDRVISARMQGRVGPPILQPYYDVRKLLGKERVSVNSVEGTYVACALVFACLAGGIFYTGGNLLLCVFVITLSSLFFIIAAYSSRSPYAEVGAARETLQVMSYEPMVLLMAVGFFMAAGSFDVSAVFSLDAPIVTTVWLVFLGLLFILTIKLRKSPFDLSMSHHAHQEIVRGVTTEMSGPTLALVEIMHWCETVLFMGWVGMFFVWGSPLSVLLAVVVALAVYFLEIWIDNNFARVKWQFMLKSAWAVALVAGGVNLAVLMFI